MPLAFLAILAVGDVFWGSLFSGIALIVAAWIAKGNTKMIKSIDRAVNDQERGMPTLVGRVIGQDDRSIETAKELAIFREWTQDAFIAFAEVQGVTLPTFPVPVEPSSEPVPGNQSVTK